MKNLVSTIKQLSPLYKKWVSFYYESPCDKIHEKFGEHNKTAKSIIQKMGFFLL